MEIIVFKIERATTEDFERVYLLLLKFNATDISKEEWRKLFTKHWKSPEDFYGHIIVKDGEVKGFLGLIFSNRIFNGEVYKFCNITSWIVDEDCRSQSLFLLLEMLKLKNYTFTNFTASNAVAAVLVKLGFKEFEVNQQVLLPAPNLFLRGGGYSCEFDLQKIREQLNENERTIFDDHRNLGCEHLLLKSNNGYAYVVLKKTQRRNIPFAKVHYLSDAEHFVGGIEKFIIRVCRRLKIFGVMVDERYLGDYKIGKSIRYRHQRKAYYKPSSEALEAAQIDTLYSELVVLYTPKVAA